jgi:hypothetical protein
LLLVEPLPPTHSETESSRVALVVVVLAPRVAFKAADCGVVETAGLFQGKVKRDVECEALDACVVVVGMVPSEYGGAVVVVLAIGCNEKQKI